MEELDLNQYMKLYIWNLIMLVFGKNPWNLILLEDELITYTCLGQSTFP
jgi:hypothetical protein